MTGAGPYDCREAFSRLDDYVDRELSDDEMRLVREHLETCAACAPEFAFEAELLVSLRATLRRIAAPAELREQVARAIAAELARAEGR